MTHGNMIRESSSSRDELQGALAGKVPKYFSPGLRILRGAYVNDLGQTQPWVACYDIFGRMIGRTGYDAGNKAVGIPDVHWEAWEYGPGRTDGQKKSFIMRQVNIQVRLAFYNISGAKDMGSELQDSKIEEYYGLRPLQFPVLSSLSLIETGTHGESPIRIDLHLDLHQLDTITGARLILRFYGIRELVFRQPTWTNLSVDFLRVHSIRDRQWEALNYRVVDDNDEVLSFLCQDFDAILKSNATGNISE